MGGITNANCWVHARRDLADAIKALANEDKQKAGNTIAYQALTRIGAIYKLEVTLRDLSSEERLRERQKGIARLVDKFFTWVKRCVSDTTVLPRGKNGTGPEALH